MKNWYKKWNWLILVCCLLLCGCSQRTTGEEYEDITPWEEGEKDLVVEPTVQAPAVFSIAYQDGRTLDPLICSDGAQLQVSELLYEPLFQVDENFHPLPLLCTSYIASPDNMVYTLEIRQGVTFSDGSTMDAADVASTLRRAMASQRYGNRLRDIQQVSARGSQVVINLSRPNSRFAALLDIPVVKAGSENNTVPVGTGPYLLITSEEGPYLHANPDWWQGRAVPLERIELVSAKDSDTVLYLFTSREVQVYAADLTGGTGFLTGSFDLTDMPTAVMQFIGLNTRRTALQDPALRKALSLGIDRQTVVEGYLSGHGMAAQFPVSPMAADYPDTLEKSYSLENYRQAVAALGERQRRLTLLVNGDNSFKTAIAKYLAQALTTGSLVVEVKALPWAEYLTALERGDFDLYYGAVRLGADWDISPLIGSSGTLNYGGWSDPGTDALLEAFRAEGSATEQIALYRHLQEVVPLIPVCFKNDSLLTHSGVVEKAQPTAWNIFQNFPDWVIHLAEEAA